jgi:hypothetical protein
MEGGLEKLALQAGIDNEKLQDFYDVLKNRLQMKKYLREHSGNVTGPWSKFFNVSKIEGSAREALSDWQGKVTSKNFTLGQAVSLIPGIDMAGLLLESIEESGHNSTREEQLSGAVTAWRRKYLRTLPTMQVPALLEALTHAEAINEQFGVPDNVSSISSYREGIEAWDKFKKQNPHWRSMGGF